MRLLIGGRGGNPFKGRIIRILLEKEDNRPVRGKKCIRELRGGIKVKRERGRHTR